MQSPDDYVSQLSATTGMPHVLVRRNMVKIASVLTRMSTVLGGLTRGLDLGLFDTWHGEHEGHALSFYPRTESLGVVLPSNSPGVHSLWVPAIPLKTPLVLKPGSAEPWTPFRIAQAFIRANCPPEAFSYYPTDHAGAGEIVRRTGRSMFFGDVSAVGAYEGDPRVELHGPGYSKILIGDDRLGTWQEHLEMIALSIADNGGRSCVNASGVWVAASHAERVAEAVADRLATIVPRAADDEQALIAPFADPRVAERISQQIDAGLETAGAVDVTARYRSGPRLVTHEGSTYLLPTVVLCDGPDHPLANREFLFPFAAVVAVAADEMSRMPVPLGKTLVLTALTGDRALSIGCWRRRSSIGSTWAPSQPIRSAGISRTRATCSSTSMLVARSRRASRLRRRPWPRRSANPVVHGWRRRDVLRQLPARQCVGRRAPRARP